MKASTRASTATLRDNGSINSIQMAVNILLVDDDVWFRLLVRGFLTRSPYRLMEAANVFIGIYYLLSGQKSSGRKIRVCTSFAICQLQPRS